VKIGIIAGRTRPGRLGSAVGEWGHAIALAHGGADYELIELADYDLELLNSPTVPGTADRQYDDPKVTRWSEKIDSLDAFVFVTPEYNHSVPAAFKNAFDVIYPEWNHKALGLISYGAEGGVRSVEHWRQIAANAFLVAVRSQVSLSTFEEFTDGKVTPKERRVAEVERVLDSVISLTKKLRG